MNAGYAYPNMHLHPKKKKTRKLEARKKKQYYIKKITHEFLERENACIH